MKYRKYLRIVSATIIIICSGLGNAWANDKGSCEKLYQARQYERAFPVCSKDARRGGIEAQFKLGAMYSLGQGVKEDASEAAKWYRKAAEQGDDDAQFLLGLQYYKGIGIKKNYTEAIKWLRKAAIQGNTDAQAIIGDVYLKAAEQGDALGQFLLGLDYYKGQGVKQDYAEAIRWLRKSATQGNTDAQFIVGNMYQKGTGVKPNQVEAVKWFRKVAEQGDADAQFVMGWSYELGSGTIKSGTAAADWYYKAGLNYLKAGNRDKALTSAGRIKKLGNIPNAFLADKLLAQVYGGSVAKQVSPKHKKKKATSIVSGTGWLVAGGYVVTNNHVVAGRKNIVLLRRDGVEIPATIIATDTANDLALLKPDNNKSLPRALPLANRPARVGEHVFTIGYPHPDMMGKEAKLTDGIINARTGLGNDPRVYQISVPLQGGNSGGPLLNMKGEVVGVAASKMSAVKVFKWTGDLPQNVNYAVKVGYVRVLLSSVDTNANVRELPSRKDSLAELANRIEGSVLMIIAE